MNKILFSNLIFKKNKFFINKINQFKFSINNNDYEKHPTHSRSGLRLKKPPPKKFIPQEKDLKMKFPDKEPEALNLKKFRYKDKIAELKKNVADIIQPATIKENYASAYYRLNLNKEFDLFELRNILYTYLFVRQRNGHIYLSINDYDYKVFPNYRKNKKYFSLIFIRKA